MAQNNPALTYRVRRCRAVYALVEPALPGIKDGELPHPPSGDDTGSNGLGNTGSGGCMPGTWLEWSEAEGEEQGSRSEECRAMEALYRGGWCRHYGNLLLGGLRQEVC